ncbi:hypothetical protein K458DRAFT_293128 [Lentithecium fluviatile CBS 122367]|uniref:Uncharacterized protein n=1 Tax=Lentithecium fluviatile CBS 122367 TaxID=1168545 RepID=A0A6G1JER7_9PLEO|nr:hypothetical protein K458DRAFT_293128 [Lentithecium fluviatile CBS 122367]
MLKIVGLALLFASTIQAAVTQKDFTGIGNIHVLNSSDWRSASPANKVGCLDNRGKFINPANNSDCGVFSRLDKYPYTLSTVEGNCTFNDETQEKNTDSYYGKRDSAWNCLAPFQVEVYDELYTIDGFPYPFLCFGDVACYYDAKSIPRAGGKTSLWQFRWGSQQMGITPGHVMLQLMWNKLGDLPKREDAANNIPGPRISLAGGLQVPLQGQQIKY